MINGWPKKRTRRSFEVPPAKARAIILEYRLNRQNRVKTIQQRHKVSRSTIQRLWRNRDLYMLG